MAEVGEHLYLLLSVGAVEGLARLQETSSERLL